MRYRITVDAEAPQAPPIGLRVVVMTTWEPQVGRRDEPIFEALGNVVSAEPE